MLFANDLITYVKRLYKSRTVWRQEAEAQARFSTEAYIILRSGGWFPGRSVRVPESILWHQHAVAIIAEFGELSFAGPGADYSRGQDVICSSVSIGEPNFDDEMRRIGLCDIGCIAGRSTMYVNMEGFIYCDGMSQINPFARSIDRALECLLRGIEVQETDICDHKQVHLSMS